MKANSALFLLLILLTSCSLFTSKPQTGTVKDIDGNIYQTVKIGDQVWMAENLKVTHYRNGEEIPKVTSSSEWGNLSNGAYCYYNNGDNYADTSGCLYNWYTVVDSRGLAPVGWRIPSDADWKILEMFLGMTQEEADTLLFRGTDQGEILKSTYSWAENGNGVDAYELSIRPGGYRVSYIITFFTDMGRSAIFWTTSELDYTYPIFREFYYNNSGIYRDSAPRNCAFSIRCIKN